MKKLLFLLGLTAIPNTLALAAGVPEPGLLMYGAIADNTSLNPVVTSGTLTWTIVPASGGAPVTVTTALTNLNGQYSYLLRVPFEELLGSTTLSANALAANSTPKTYYRSQVFVNGTNAATLVAPAQPSFTFKSSDRGVMERVDLLVTLPAGQGGGSGPTSGGTNSVPAGGSSSQTAARFVGITKQSSGSIELKWTGSTNQLYCLCRSTNFSMPGSISVLGSNLVAVQPFSTFVDTNTSGSEVFFYRLQAQ